MFRNSFASIFPLLFALTVNSCNTSSFELNDPKNTLKEYVSKSFSVRSPEDRKELLKLLTGEVKARLTGWSDDQFMEAFVDSKREFIKLAFREVKSISANEVNITYELVFMDKGKPRGGDAAHEAKVTSRKLCRLVQENGKWLITDVRNIKELLEFQGELALP